MRIHMNMPVLPDIASKRARAGVRPLVMGAGDRDQARLLGLAQAQELQLHIQLHFHRRRLLQRGRIQVEARAKGEGVLQRIGRDERGWKPGTHVSEMMVGGFGGAPRNLGSGCC